MSNQIIIDGKFYRELRCFNCRKLLGYEYILAGRFATPCPRCGEMNKHNFKHIQTKENVDTIDAEFAMKGGEKIENG